MRLSAGNPFALEELAAAGLESGWIDPALGSPLGHRDGGAPLDPRRVDPGPRRRPGPARARADRLGGGHRRALRPAPARGRRGARPRTRLWTRWRCWRGPASWPRTRPTLRATPSPSATPWCTRRSAARGWRLSARGATGRSWTRARPWPRRARSISAAQLARHAVAAGERERAIAHSRAAASGALELGAVEEAVAHLERALGLWTSRTGPACGPSCCSPAGVCGRAHRAATSGRGDLLEEALGPSGPRRRGQAAWAWRSWPTRASSWAAWDEALDEWERAVATLRRSRPADALAPRWPPTGGRWRSSTARRRPTRAADEGLALVPAAATAAEALRPGRASSRRKGLVALFRCRRGGDGADGRGGPARDGAPRRPRRRPGAPHPSASPAAVRPPRASTGTGARGRSWWPGTGCDRWRPSTLGARGSCWPRRGDWDARAGAASTTPRRCSTRAEPADGHQFGSTRAVPPSSLGPRRAGGAPRGLRRR